MSFERLVRFIDEDGQYRYGNLEHALGAKEIKGVTVQLLSGSLQMGFQRTPEQATVETLLCPLESTPLVLCAGVNYKSHASETKFQPPEKPILFATPPDRLAGPIAEIPIHADAQELLDYEGELTIIIGKDGRDIPEEDALDYVFGYTIGNDVSARGLLPVEISGWQMGYAKSFDHFAPIGPSIVSPKIISDPQQLQLRTKVNRQVRQNASTLGMIWTCRQLISFASRGRTLRCGTIIMTGTPEGVGWHTNGCLKDGDEVEVTITKMGSINNKMVFQKT